MKTVADIGRKGGTTTAARYGSEFYRRIGEIGQQKRAAKRREERLRRRRQGEEAVATEAPVVVPAQDEKKGAMPLEEAGRRGGQATAATHDHGHYQAIGHVGGTKGGAACYARHGTKYYKTIGRKGGLHTKAREA